MLYYSVLFVSFFIVAFVIRFKRKVFYGLAQNSVALVNELLSGNEDEDEKIELIQKKTNKLAVSLLKMLFYILVSFALGSIPLIIYGFFSASSYSAMSFTSFYSIVAISAGATVPFLLPNKKKGEETYSELSQLLHHLALDNYQVSEKLFKREKKRIKKYNLKLRNDFVVISGLARAGTTSLMNDLSKLDKFVSLSYANMPFLMAPNLWAKFYKPKSSELKERSHKDGIMIGLESNEALEEYFFKVKANDSYINENSLSEYKITEETFNDYLAYQAIIKNDNEKIYLAKNNNFILRYKSAREFDSDFVMAILYRNPLTHAASLMEKHKEYIEQQEKDPFVLEYMNWLGHHEFGKNQKPFVFGDHFENENDKTDINYWLKIWINYYSYVLSIDHPNTILINYDSYCEFPKQTLEKILDKTGITSELPELKSFVNKRKPDVEYSKEILDEAMGIYDKLNDK